jgi:hypothetical protein
MISHPVCSSDSCLCKEDQTLDEAIARLRKPRVIA